MRRMGRPILHISLLALLALVVTGCDAGNARAKQPAATATPSPTPVPQVLYQANWKAGVDKWNLTPGWSLSAAGLSNNGLGAAPLVIPYTPTVKDYTIAIALKVNAVRGGPQACGNQYGLKGETPAGKSIYYAAITCIQHNLHTFAVLYSATDTSHQFNTNDYTPSTNSRTYTITVRGESVSYQINDAFVGSITCNLPTAPSRLVLLNANMDTAIQSITITTP
jgi:hypothetical protein